MMPDESTTVMQAAEIYAAMGLMPVPVYGFAGGHCTCHAGEGCAKPGKHPIGNDWQRRATNDLDLVRDAFRAHRGNIGIFCGGQVVVIDADGDEGVANLAQLGAMPRTLTAVSGSGKGRHYVYRLMPGQSPANITDRSSKVAPKVDIKIRGQFVVAPSLHQSGQRYRWIEFVEPAALPDWLYQRIRNQPAIAPALALRVVRGGGAEMYDRARAYVKAMPAAVSGQGGHSATFAAARKIVGNGLPTIEELALLMEYNQRCDPPWSDKELDHKLEQARQQGENIGLPERERAAPMPAAALAAPREEPTEDWRTWLHMEQTRHGVARLKRTGDNAVIILQFDPRWRGRVRYDVFRQQIAIVDPPWDAYQVAAVASPTWTDSDVQRLKGWLIRHYGLDLSTSDVREAAQTAARHASYSSARDWMVSLSWDGALRLDSWLTTCLGVESTSYSASVGRWWITSAVARVFDPGCKADHVLILEGLQGMGKSSALRTLVGAQWFSDTPFDIGSKDAFMAMGGRLVVEMAELDSLKRADAERAKSFFTSAVDSYRPPYGSEVVTVPRSCVFAGTVNHAEYLKDDTGNRRYWPVKCTKADLAAIALQRDQIWAEAVAAYRSGAAWYPIAADEHAVCAEEQEVRSTRDEWEHVIGEWITSNAIQKLVLADVLERALHIPKGQWSRGEQMRAAGVMHRLGFSVKSEWADGATKRVYRKV